MTAWFESNNQEKSPGEENGRQLRRVTRLIKKYAKSRPSWKPLVLSGFGITTLVVECYAKNADREDSALYDTMKAIRDRLNKDLSVKHPVTPDEYITKEKDDPKARNFRDKLSEAIQKLEPLFKDDCSQAKARKCWDDVYDTTYFSDLNPKEEKSASASAAPVLTSGLLRDAAANTQPSVNKAGGGRYA